MAREWQTKLDNTAPTDTGVLTANEHNSIGEEQEALVKSAGLTPVAYDAGSDPNQKQWSEAVARYASAGIFATDGGAADAYVLSGITITGASEAVRTPQAYFEPLRILWVPANSNTGPSTVNAFGIGSTTIRTYLDTALAGGEIIGGRPCMMRYDESAASGSGAFLIEPWADPTLYATGYTNSPIYPQCDETDNELVVSNLGSGTLEVAASQNFIWRGWVNVGTSSFSSGDRQVTTSSSKTYHLHWHAPGTGDATPESSYPFGRFRLKDLSDSGYNPSTLAEADEAFDTTYDDMLIARVVTDGSNVPTITLLANAHALNGTGTESGSNEGFEDDVAPDDVSTQGHQVTLNWSRKPYVALRAANDWAPVSATDTSSTSYEVNMGWNSQSRYSIYGWCQRQGNSIGGYWISYDARA